MLINKIINLTFTPLPIQIKYLYLLNQNDNMKKQKMNLKELKKYFSRRLLYVRNNQARYLVHKTDFLMTCKVIGNNKLIFDVVIDEKRIFVEQTTQIN